MADGQWGGYRRPSEPAAVSGPGSMSARTDGGATSPPPLASEPGQGAQVVQGQVVTGSATPASSRPNLPPLDAPSARPEEPVTAGAPLGPGIGPGAAGVLPAVSIDIKDIQPLLYRLDVLASLPSSTAQTRAWVRDLKARLGTRN